MRNIVKDVRKEHDEPFDRLVMVAAEMTKLLDAPECKDIKGIVMLSDEDGGGTCIHGYDDEIDAITDMFAHLSSALKSIGRELVILESADN